jgi:hypothetical protein
MINIQSLVTSAAAGVHGLLAGTLVAAWLHAPIDTSACKSRNWNVSMLTLQPCHQHR